METIMLYGLWVGSMFVASAMSWYYTGNNFFGYIFILSLFTGFFDVIGDKEISEENVVKVWFFFIFFLVFNMIWNVADVMIRMKG